jgi:parvulin-like peptidyl-prolyl isomerase
MDPSASNGGDIGFLPKGSLAPQYEDAAFALPVGGVSDLVRTQLGYHIIKVTGKKNEGIAELEEVRSNLGEYLKNQRIEAELGKIVIGLYKTAKVEILLPLAAPLNPGDSTISSPRP